MQSAAEASAAAVSPESRRPTSHSRTFHTSVTAQPSRRDHTGIISSPTPFVFCDLFSDTLKGEGREGKLLRPKRTESEGWWCCRPIRPAQQELFSAAGRCRAKPVWRSHPYECGSGAALCPSTTRCGVRLGSLARATSAELRMCGTISTGTAATTATATATGIPRAKSSNRGGSRRMPTRARSSSHPSLSGRTSRCT